MTTDLKLDTRASLLEDDDTSYVQIEVKIPKSVTIRGGLTPSRLARLADLLQRELLS